MPIHVRRGRAKPFLDRLLATDKKRLVCPEDGGVAAKVHGEEFSRFKIGLREYVAVSEPDALEKVFVINRENYPQVNQMADED